MSKNFLKTIIWLVLLGIGGGAALGAIYGAGALITYFNTGADPAAALNIQPNIPPDWPVEIEWIDSVDDTGRKIEPFIQTQIESAYVRAWLQQTFSYTKGEPHGLKTYFSGPALAMVEDNLAAYAESNRIVSQVATSHLLELHFYSADGTIAAFTDREAHITHYILDADGNELLAVEEVAAFQVVMIVDEGNWKIRHWLRRDVAEYGAPRDADPDALPPDQPLVEVDATSGQLVLDGAPYEIRGVNYYPQEHAWLEMWEQYDGEVIGKDFALISDLGLNTIRIFVPYELFGRDGVTEKEFNLYLQRLRDLLNTAYDHDLRVIVTLFDFKGEYDLLSWPKADRHLEGILTTFNRHPAILAWDLKNEPDLDYDHAGQQLVNIWLSHVLAAARRHDPNHLITIGWASPESATTLADELDFVSYHYYGLAEELVPSHEALREAVGPAKPVVLGEFGLPTWNSYLFPNGHSEEEQANYFAEILGALQKTDATGFMVWTLYDFAHVPSSVAGRMPWRRSPQKEMGLIRGDGTYKPAIRFIEPGATFVPPYELTIIDRLTKPFYLTAYVSLMMGSILFALIIMWLIWKGYVGRFLTWIGFFRLLSSQSTRST